VSGDRGSVLVTDGGSGGSRDALAAVRALHAAGYRVAVTTSGAGGPRPSRRALRRVAVPPVSSPAYVDAVRAELAETGHVTVVPASEASLAALGVRVPHLLDKMRVADAARAVGLEVPPQRAFADTAALLAAGAELDFPVVVKPRTRRYLAFRADQRADLDRAPADGGPLVVQPFVTEPLHAVSGVLWEGRLVAAAHERWLRIWPYPCGLACAAETTRVDVVAEERLVALVGGHDGIFCAQFAGPHLLDVNLRIHSSHPLAVAAGANLVALWCDLVAGRPVRETRARPGFFYRWLEGDLRHVAQEARTGRMTVPEALAALRPRRGAAHSTESLADPGPLLSRLWYSARRVHLGPERRSLGSPAARGNGVPRVG
jgi:predicted ATP-grasp superfamily ATP-dependent carboligase